MIDISKILENTPKGLKLWTPLFGEVEFLAVSKNSDFKAGVSIEVYVPSSRHCYVSFNPEGKLEDNAPDMNKYFYKDQVLSEREASKYTNGRGLWWG